MNPCAQGAAVLLLPSAGHQMDRCLVSDVPGSGLSESAEGGCVACGWKNLELVQLSWIGADFTIYSRAHILSSFSSVLTWRRKWQPTPVLLPGNSPGGGAWYATVHGVAERPTGLSDFTFHALEKEMATHSSVLAWRIPGTGGLVGCRLWGSTESDTTGAT